MSEPNRYYSLAVNDREADVLIFGDITSWPYLASDVSSYNLQHQIAGLDVDTINVHINSYGGEVAESLAIMNALLQHKAKIVTYVDGFACSGASVILMAGDRRVAAKCSNLLVHPAWGGVTGNAAQLRAEADNLDAITEQSITAYLSRISKGREELVSLMEEERFLTPEEALEWGFVTEIQDLFGAKQPSQSVRKLVYDRLRQSASQPAFKTPSQPTQLQHLLATLGKY